MRFILSLCLLVLAIRPVFAQNEIYVEKEIKEGQVIDVTADKIKYKNPQNPGPVYSLSRGKVLFIFNTAGKYLVIANNDSSDLQFAAFQHADVAAASADKIFTSQSQRIDCSIISEEDNAIRYSTGKGKYKIAKSDVIGIIYKTGKHKILTQDFTLAASVLKKFQQQELPYSPQSSSPVAAPIQAPAASTAAYTASPTTPSVAPAPPPATATATTTAMATPPPPKTAAATRAVTTTSSATPPAAAPAATSPAMAVTPAATPAATPAKTVTGSEKNVEYIDELNEITFSEYEKKALQKTSELSEYLRLLCNKSTSYDQANKAIDQACTLFVSEDASVELSTLGQKGVQRFKIRDYFKRLKLVKYGKVDIQWAHIQYVSKLRKAPDGTYRGVITVEQTFSGFIENKLVYSDVTKKNIEVVLKTYNKSSEGKSKTMWDILLSDIKVVETKNS